jgi:hypothetical protein
VLLPLHHEESVAAGRKRVSAALNILGLLPESEASVET